ncbi:mRNA-decapping enzyme subunit 2 [Balamuthia mandrillaris]
MSANLESILDDLSSRFILNCPEEELSSFERICFQIEAAHWFYQDFYREQDPKLPAFNLKAFARRMFEACPLLSPYLATHSIDEIMASFTHYKTRVPVCGAIVVNPSLDKCLLVKGWHAKSSWGFPKGKINKDEREIDCAKREVYEETGFVISDDLINDEDYIEFQRGEQKVRLYIVYPVPDDTNFAPRTRKEISKIKWHLVSELPSFPTKTQTGTRSANFWMVVPVVPRLKQWIRAKKKKERRNLTSSTSSTIPKKLLTRSTSSASSSSLESPNTTITTTTSSPSPAQMTSANSASSVLQSILRRSLDSAAQKERYEAEDEAEKEKEREQESIMTNNYPQANNFISSNYHSFPYPQQQQLFPHQMFPPPLPTPSHPHHPLLHQPPPPQELIPFSSHPSHGYPPHLPPPSHPSHPPFAQPQAYSSASQSLLSLVQQQPQRDNPFTNFRFDREVIFQCLP